MVFRKRMDQDISKVYFAVFGQNEFELLPIFRWAIPKHLKVFIVKPGISKIIALRHIPFINRYIQNTVTEYKDDLGKYKGLWYQADHEALDLTLRFYEENFTPKSKFVTYYNRILHTNKFEAFIKKKISFQISRLLTDLYLVELSPFKEKEILINRNPLNRFIVKHMETKHNITYKIIWVPSFPPLFYLGVYYMWLLKDFIKRGVSFHKIRKEYKLSAEAVDNFHRRILRDDLLIDDKNFKKKDLLILELNPEHRQRTEAFREAKKRGFDTVSVPKLKVNLRKNILGILFFYLWTPQVIFLNLLFEKKSYLFYYAVLFYITCFPTEILMNHYKIKCNISSIDVDDIARTIILNKYGAKNVIYHWSDLTIYKTYSHAFVAHNIYFVWGDIHYDFHEDNLFVDKKINIGCIFESGYAQLAADKRYIKQLGSINTDEKIVAYFDTSFGGRFTEDFFIEYMNIIREFCENRKNIKVLLKPKQDREKAREKLSKHNRNKYDAIWDALVKCDNFTCLDYSQFEEAIAVSDVCVSMGMNTPSTIALICGKNGLYFDNTGNIYHPFAKKYKDIIVFDKRDLLFKQLDNILANKFNYKDIISETELQEYDTFRDDKAVERLRERLFRET